MTTPNDMNKRIKKNMNKHIYTKAFKALAIVFMTTIVLIFTLHLALVQTNYNPNKEEPFLMDEATSEYDVLFTTYYQLTHPGMLYLNANHQDTIPSKGFGNYQTTACIQSSFEPVHLGPIPNATVHIKNSISTLQSNVGGVSIDEFNRDKNTLQPTLDDIVQLPEPTYLDVSIGFKQPHTLETIATIMNREDVNVQYIAFKDQNLLPYEGATGGFNTIEVFGWGIISNYPDFILKDESIDAKMLKTSYLSHLQLLVDHPRFVASIPDLSLERLETCLENAKKELLATGIRLHVTKPELLSLIDDYPISSIQVHATKATKYIG